MVETSARQSLICTFKILKLFLEGSVSIFRMCMASSDFLLSFGYVLSEFLAYLSGLRASTGTGSKTDTRV